jgi:hypothetical protein
VIEASEGKLKTGVENHDIAALINDVRDAIGHHATDPWHVHSPMLCEGALELSTIVAQPSHVVTEVPAAIHAPTLVPAILHLDEPGSTAARTVPVTISRQHLAPITTRTQQSPSRASPQSHDSSPISSAGSTADGAGIQRAARSIARATIVTTVCHGYIFCSLIRIRFE